MTVTTFEVVSNTTPGKTYEVSFDDDSQRWACTCPFVPRKGGTTQQCVHIFDKQADVVSGNVILPQVQPESLDEAFGVFTQPGGVTPHVPKDWVEPVLAAVADAHGIDPDDLKEYVNLPKDDLPPAHAADGAEAYRGAIEQAQLLEKNRQEHEEVARFAEAIALSPNTVFEVQDAETAILAVYGDVDYVQKTRAEQLNYSFAGEAAILAALRPSMVRHGLTARVTKVRRVKTRLYESKSGNTMVNTTLELRVTFVHAPSGTKVNVWARGEGSDSGDKSTPKAMTGAFKYAFRQTFSLETGNDPDHTASRDLEGRSGPSERETRQARRDVLTRGGGQPGDTPPWWQWFIKERNGAGLGSADLEPVLGGKKPTPATVTEWLEALTPPPTDDDSTTIALRQLLKRAADRKAAGQ